MTVLISIPLCCFKVPCEQTHMCLASSSLLHSWHLEFKTLPSLYRLRLVAFHPCINLVTMTLCKYGNLAKAFPCASHSIKLSISVVHTYLLHKYSISSYFVVCSVICCFKSLLYSLPSILHIAFVPGRRYWYFRDFLLFLYFFLCLSC